MRRAPLAAVVLGALLSSCVAAVPHPLPLHAERSGVPLEVLEQGRSLFVSHCGNCHQAPDPGTRDAHQWAQLLPEMLEDSHLDPKQAAQVLAFLQALSSQAPTEVPMPERRSEVVSSRRR